tara:strand:- start:6637 stop:7053 length:417 start_codon:yes stop_codon:yes gene_type:complete
MTVEITPVPLDLVNHVWDSVKGFIKSATDTTGGKYNEDDVYNDIQRGTYVLWIIVDKDDIIGTLTTRIAAYPNRRSMSIDWLGGNRLEELLPVFHPVMEQYAKDNRCTHLEGYGRGGWARTLKDYGWKADFVVYNMEL